MKRFSLVGAGGYAQEHAKALLARHARKELEFCGVVIRPQDRPSVQSSIELLEGAQIPIFPDTASMYASVQPDVVALPIAIGAHCPFAVDAVSRGINVIVEKPAAGSLAEVDKMREAEASTGKFIAVGFQHIYAKDVHQLKGMLTAGQFGQVRRIAVMGRWPRPETYYRRNEWVCKERGANGEAIFDSPINNAFAHYLNLGLFFAGSDFDKSAHASEMQAELYRARQNIETFDTCGVRLKTANGVDIICLLTHACGDNVNPKLRLECDNAVITWAEATSWKADLADGRVLTPDVPPRNGRDDMMDALIEKAEGKKPFVCTLDIAREHTYVIENLHKFFQPSNIPEGNFVLHPDNGQYVIPDITEIFNRGFEEFRLPSELGAPWSQRSRVIALL